MQKHKGGTKWFVWTNLHVSHFSKCVKGLVVHSAQESGFSIEGGTWRLIAAYFGIYSRLLCV